MKKKAFALALALGLSLSTLTACGESGTITSKKCTIPTKKPFYCGKYRVTVEDANGNKSTFTVARANIKNCSVGEKYPECK